MRRSTDSLIALQCLTAVVPVALLLLAARLAEARRAPAHYWNSGSHFLPHYLTRLFHHGFALKQPVAGASVAVKAPLQISGDADDQ